MQFGEAFTTGSSMMPQKRNPDALELARALSGRIRRPDGVVGDAEGAPERLQQGHAGGQARPVRRGDAVQLVLPAVAGAVAEMTFRTDPDAGGGDERA